MYPCFTYFNVRWKRQPIKSEVKRVRAWETKREGEIEEIEIKREVK